MAWPCGGLMSIKKETNLANRASEQAAILSKMAVKVAPEAADGRPVAVLRSMRVTYNSLAEARRRF